MIGKYCSLNHMCLKMNIQMCRNICTHQILKKIMEKFVASGWELIAIPAKEWLDGKSDKNTLVSAIKQADKECGSCGCELDSLYKRALELL